MFEGTGCLDEEEDVGQDSEEDEETEDDNDPDPVVHRVGKPKGLQDLVSVGDGANLHIPLHQKILWPAGVDRVVELIGGQTLEAPLEE